MTQTPEYYIEKAIYDYLVASTGSLSPVTNANIVMSLDITKRKLPYIIPIVTEVSPVVTPIGGIDRYGLTIEVQQNLYDTTPAKADSLFKNVRNLFYTSSFNLNTYLPTEMTVEIGGITEGIPKIERGIDQENGIWLHKLHLDLVIRTQETL